MITDKLLIPDLFGGETPMPEKKAAGAYAETKRRMGYRKGGTDARCCKTCAKSKRVPVSTYSVYKCAYIGNTRSQATDIGATCVCNEWE